MEQWKRFIWPFVWSAWSVLIVLQIILSFFLHNQAGLSVLRHAGWITLTVSAVFGWLPIFAFRKKGSLPDTFRKTARDRLARGRPAMKSPGYRASAR